MVKSDWVAPAIGIGYIVLFFVFLLCGMFLKMQPEMSQLFGEIVIGLMSPLGIIIGFYYGKTAAKLAFKK